MNLTPAERAARPPWLEFDVPREQQIVHGLLGEDVGPQMAIKAYHGSPHKFDKFDLSKIGTGEGAQAYGHGFYFAEDPREADVYKNALSKAEIADASGKALYTPAPKGDYSRAGSAEERAMSALQYAHDTQSSAP
jgi:hypothetical protein